MVDHTESLDVAISGGSMGGLFTGLALRHAERDVNIDIYERSTGQLKHRGAGIVAQPEIREFVATHDIATPEAITTTTSTRRYLDSEGNVKREYEETMTFAAWDVLYRQLRAAFPDEDYHTSRAITDVDRGTTSEDVETEPTDGERATLRFEDGTSVRTDLAVIAEGGQSTTRDTLVPGVSPEYAGYVAWRGVAPEEEVSPTVGEEFDDVFTFYEGDDDLVLAYFIPGREGETDEGERRLNWVWYDAIEREERRDLLTDADGEIHDFSVPPGELRADVDRALLAAADERLPEVFDDLVATTDDRFVQTIYDLAVPRMAFGRTCLLGDAAFVARPHTAAGTAKAAADGTALAEALEANGKAETALDRWEDERLDAGRQLVAQGKRMGENYMD